MLVTALDAKTQLEAEGLHVSRNNTHSLWIAANTREMAEGMKVSNDACSLVWDGGRWFAIFPADGLLTYEVPGTLSELVAMISTVYRQYRQAGGEFKDALKQVVGDSERYLVRPSPARV